MQLIVIGLSAMMQSLAMDIFSPCIPVLTQALACSQDAVQLAAGISLFASGLGQLILGPVIDSFNAKKLMLISCLAFLGVSFFSSLVTSINMLILFRLALGLAAGGVSISYLTLVKQLCPESSKAAKAYSCVQGIVALSPILGPVLASYLLVHYNWQAVYLSLAFLAAIMFYLNYKFLPVLPDNVQKLYFKEICLSYLSILKNRQFLSFSISIITGVIALFLYYSLAPLILVERLNFSLSEFSLIFSANSVVYLCANLISSRVQKYFSELKYAVILGLSFMTLGASLAISWQKFIGFSAYTLICSNFIISFGVGFLIGPAIALTLKPFTNLAGRAAALYGFLSLSIAALFVTIIINLSENFSAYTLGLPLLGFSLFSISLIYLNQD